MGACRDSPRARAKFLGPPSASRAREQLMNNLGMWKAWISREGLKQRTFGTQRDRAERGRGTTGAYFRVFIHSFTPVRCFVGKYAQCVQFTHVHSRRLLVLGDSGGVFVKPGLLSRFMKKPVLKYRAAPDNLPSFHVVRSRCTDANWHAQTGQWALAPVRGRCWRRLRATRPLTSSCCTRTARVGSGWVRNAPASAAGGSSHSCPSTKFMKTTE